MNLLSHGLYTIEKFDDIVYIKFIDGFNLETYSQFIVDIEKVGKEFNGRRWAEIHDYRNWGLAPQEIFDKAKSCENNEEKLKNRCSDQVMVIENKLIIEVIRKVTTDPILLTPLFVKTEKEAFDYLNEIGYSGRKEV